MAQQDDQKRKDAQIKQALEAWEKDLTVTLENGETRPKSFAERQPIWLNLWEAVDFSWEALADAGWERGDDANYAQKLKRWKAPEGLPVDRPVIGEGEMAYKQASLQDYWRFTPLPDGGWRDEFDTPNPLGLRNNIPGKTLLAFFDESFVLDATGLGQPASLDDKQDQADLQSMPRHSAAENGGGDAGRSPAAYLADMILKRLDAATPYKDAGYDGRCQFSGCCAQGMDEIWQIFHAAAMDDAPKPIHLNMRLAQFQTLNANGLQFGDQAGFAGAQFGEWAQFTGAQFGERAQFARAQFGDQAGFAGAQFGEWAQFMGAQFGDQARFGGARFGEWAQFTGAQFGEEAEFARARFGDQAGFTGAQFGELARFSDARFGDQAGFADARFGEEAGFRGAQFGERAEFMGAQFGDRARFRGAQFGEEAEFAAAQFGERAKFTAAQFGAGAGFEDARFGEEAEFARAQFGEWAQFMGAQFGDQAGFRGARFGEEAEFARAQFGAQARFEDAQFGDQARFRGARFGEEAEFARAQFGDQAGFARAQFGEWAQFMGAQFGDQARFGGARFGDQARFRGAQFGEEAEFARAQFGEGAEFMGAQFGDQARFNGAQFGEEAEFARAQFGEEAGFEDAQFGDQAGFRGAQFGERAQFDNAQFGAGAGFEDAQFGDQAEFDGADFKGNVSFEDVVWATDAHYHSSFMGARFRDVADFRTPNFSSFSIFDGADFQRKLLLSEPSGEHTPKTLFKRALNAAEGAVAKSDEAEAENKIYGQLSGGYRTAKNAMEKDSDFERAQRYYRFEVQARMHKKSTTWPEKRAAGFYALFSDYGAAIGRPFLGLFCFTLVFATLYLGLAIGVGQSKTYVPKLESEPAIVANPPHFVADSQSEDIWQALEFSMNNAFRPLSALATEEPREGALPEGEAAQLNLGERLLFRTSGGISVLVRFLSIIQSLLSFLLAFLFGLAVRRKFQIS